MEVAEDKCSTTFNRVFYSIDIVPVSLKTKCIKLYAIKRSFKPKICTRVKTTSFLCYRSHSVGSQHFCANMVIILIIKVVEDNYTKKYLCWSGYDIIALRSFLPVCRTTKKIFMTVEETDFEISFTLQYHLMLEVMIKSCVDC